MCARKPHIMISKAAAAFDRTKHNPRELAKFWKADPLAAARWTVNVAKASGAKSKAIDQLEKVLSGKGTDEAKAQKLTKLVAEEPGLLKLSDAKAMAKAQTEGAKSLSWEAAEKAESSQITGRPVLDDGKVKFKTTHGTFDLEMPYTWREEIETAFLDEIVTVKGIPSADGKSIKVDQWGPGTEPMFSGRVQVQGDEVYITPSGSVGADAALVTNPELKRILMNKGPDSDWAAWNPVGVLLPGEPKLNETTKKLEYDQFPEEGFYILGRLMKLNIQELPDGRTVHLADTGYFKKTAAFGSKDLPIPAESKPGAWPFPEGDTSTGSTTKGETGPRVFFFAKPVASDTKVEGLDLTGGTPPFTRAVELTWVSKPADVGSRNTRNWNDPAPTPAADLNVRIEQMARTLPAAEPKMKPEEATFVPEDRK